MILEAWREAAPPRARGKLYLYYYRARYYQTDLQRFISEDPIGFLGGDVNFYAYVGGNPLTFIDPLGLDWIYKQSTGDFFYLDNHTGGEGWVGRGYSGYGDPALGGGRNNSAMQHVENIGPITQGTYDIGEQGTILTRGAPGQPPQRLKGAMRLTRRGEDPFQRGGFLIHDGEFLSMNSSRGCIILPEHIRNRIGMSGDKTLRVVP